MERTSNKNCSSLVEHREEFKANNIFSTWENDDFYVVYSYGKHFPMYVYSAKEGIFYENSDKYSRSTSKQQTQARPSNLYCVVKRNTEELKNLIK